MRRTIAWVVLATWLGSPAASWATDAFISVPTGEKLDNESLTVGANTVYRQRIQITGTTATAIMAVVNSTPSDSAMGAVVRPVFPAQASTTSGQTGPLIQGAVTTSEPSYTTAQTSPLSLTTAGRLRVDAGTGTLNAAVTNQSASSSAVAVRCVNTAGNAFEACGGGVQYLVDDALGATPTGTVVLAIRDDALSSLTPVEGDAIGLRVDAFGALWKRDVWKTPLGDTMVDDTSGYDALRVTAISVVTTQPRTAEVRKEWHFTASQTDNKIVTTSGTLTVTDAYFQCDPATSVSVKYRLGFQSGSSLSAESSSGVEGIILKGWYASGGVGGQAARYAGGMVGASGDDLIFTMGAPTSGSCSLLVAYIED